jgi:periplasmic protein TonB
MFEDAVFESTGRIRTHSAAWMSATLVLNGTILVVLVLIPLIYPEALPEQALTFLLAAPPPPRQTPPPPREPEQEPHRNSRLEGWVILAPPRIRASIPAGAAPEPVPDGPLLSMEQQAGLPGGGIDVFDHHGNATVVHSDAKAPVRLSSMVVAGLLVSKTIPVYPAIAKAAGVEGTVVLQATISKSGMIENLRVVSGPVMLEQAALDATRSWRYRPYQLDGLPVEVETTIHVVFRLER